MSVSTHRFSRETAATEAASLAVKKATEAWRIVYDGGAGDNDAATVAWTAVEEAESVWKDAAWEESNVLQGAFGLENIERGLSLSDYQMALPRYIETHRLMVRLVGLLRERGNTEASIRICADRALSIEKDIGLMRSFVEAHREEAVAEEELAALRAAEDPLLGWEARVAAAGRSAIARETIIASPLYSIASPLYSS
jgi:hypothetical protein